MSTPPKANQDSEAMPWIIWLLRIGTALCFWGWAWQHIRWDVPYREILWSTGHFEWIITGMGLTWESYVGSAENDAVIQQFISNVGWVYVILGVLALTVQPRRWGHYTALSLGSVGLLLIAYLCYLDKKAALGQFVEYGSQVLSPIILLLVLSYGMRSALAMNIARLAVVATFAGHGLYAIGYYEVPGDFITMTMRSLHVEQSTAEQILQFAGIMDFAVCFSIFIPLLARPALAYACFWGFLTALARVWTGFSFDYAFWGLDQSLHQTILRVPHFIVPLYLLFAMRRPEEAPATDEAIATGENRQENGKIRRVMCKFN